MERDRVDDIGMHEDLAEEVQRAAAERFRAVAELVAWSLERGLWFLRRRVAWPVEDGAAALGTRGCIGVGGGTAFVLAAVGSAVVLLAGGGSQPATAPATPVAAASVEQPRLIYLGAGAHRSVAPQGTLHGAKPLLISAPARVQSSSPVSATISSNPRRSSGAGAATGTTGGTATASAAQAAPAHALRARTAAARAALPAGPPAGPAALKVAREFAQGFVVYETGGEAVEFRDAFQSSATPELRKALMERPPKQPAGVEVPQAKVLNVVAGPSQGSRYAVSVSLLRVGVTSELRLQMEKIEKGKRAEWRVTSVLG